MVAWNYSESRQSREGSCSWIDFFAVSFVVDIEQHSDAFLLNGADYCTKLQLIVHSNDVNSLKTICFEKSYKLKYYKK